jgi:hypothetical protein
MYPSLEPGGQNMIGTSHMIKRMVVIYVDY